MLWLKQTVEVFETHPHSESPPVVEEVFHGLPRRRGGHSHRLTECGGAIEQVNRCQNQSSGSNKGVVSTEQQPSTTGVASYGDKSNSLHL